MTIKDFEPGQTVFALEEIRGREVEYRTRRRTVRTVGRKYVKVSAEEDKRYVDEYYQRDEADNFLVENKNWGKPQLLFRSEEELTDYIETIMLRAWIKSNTEWSRLERYSLEQLREVKRILEAKGTTRAGVKTEG